MSCSMVELLMEQRRVLVLLLGSLAMLPFILYVCRGEVAVWLTQSPQRSFGDPEGGGVLKPLQEHTVLEIATASQGTAVKHNLSSANLSSRKAVTEFILESSFRLPWHSCLRAESLQRTLWLHNLRTYLRDKDPHSPVTLVSADFAFREVLLNWLIAAKVRPKAQMKYILVLTYEEHFKIFLTERAIPVLYVPIEAVVDKTDQAYWTGNHKGMRHLLIIRVAVMRLLNYWGYDVANYDADAIILRNPKAVHEMYSDSDLIGQYGGSMPATLLQEWGAVMCMGAVVLMRSSAAIDFLWEAMAKVAPSSRDDQYKLNYALKAMNISWTVTDTSRSQDKERTGLGEHGLKVTLLPPRMACRGRSCLEQSQSSCYVWHRGQTHHTNDIATKVAKQERVWFLQADWINITTASQSVGVDWLGEIAKDPDLQ